jgi:murein L,D-transpeptidase YcbB/YkuD
MILLASRKFQLCLAIDTILVMSVLTQTVNAQINTKQYIKDFKAAIALSEQDKDLNSKSTSQAKDIKAVFYKSLKALNEENIAAYLATIHPQAPDYAQSKELLTTLFAHYDIKYEINSIDIIKISENEATVRLVQTTKKIRGPEFKNNKLETLNILKKVKGQWKFYSTQPESVEFLN